MQCLLQLMQGAFLRSGLCKNGTVFSTDFPEPVENRHGVYLFGRKRGRIKNKMRDAVRWKGGRKKGMNTGVGKLHQMLFYAGLEPEEYQACLPEIRKDNRKKLRAYLIIAGIFLLVIICLLGGLEALRANRGYYLLSFVGCLVLLAIEMMLPEDNGLLLDWLMYAFEAQLYLLGMLIMKVSPEELSVSFIAFLLAVPLLFVMPPVQHISNILFFAVIFIGLVLHVKTGRIAVIDITDCVVFGMVSSIISSFMMVSMHQNFLSELRLRRFANFDILTNMQNRNAYESSRDSWAKKCTVSLSCVYVDVNGLHELNNASGHEKGDQMLQTVALELQGRFGRDNCYRTGGDEFVAFVQDEPETAVRAATDELIRALERKGCSAAIGVVTQNAGSVDLDTLIRQAEQQMYQAKEEHYRIQRQLEH